MMMEVMMMIVMMGRCGRLGHRWGHGFYFFVPMESFHFRPTRIMVVAAQAITGPEGFLCRRGK